MISIFPNASGKLPIYSKLMWIIFLAFAVRVAVRRLTGESNFWENGYTFFFALAQNIAVGNGLAFEYQLAPGCVEDAGSDLSALWIARVRLLSPYRLAPCLAACRHNQSGSRRIG